MNPIIGYPGGKTKLKKKIIERMPPHKKYVEPFCGGLSVFFAKSPAKKEVINDKDKELVRFYRAFRKKGVSVKRCDMRPSKAKFDRLKKSKPKSNQSCVCRYVYLNKRSYAGGTSFNQKASINKRDKRDKSLGTKSISKQHTTRLKHTKIENKDYKTVVKQNDSKTTFTYLDPPYPDTYDYDKPAVDPDEVCRLAKRAKGKVLISYNDHPAVRKAAKKYGLYVERVKTRYTMGMKNGGKIKTELLISNYDTRKVRKENKKRR